MQKYGGNINAYTGLDNTNYTLEIDHKGLDEGLDRFVNLLINPTFNSDKKDKIIRALHHQFKSALVNNEWSYLSLWMQLSNPDGPINK